MTYQATKLNKDSTYEDIKAALEKRSVSALQAFDLMQQIGRREAAERMEKLTARRLAAPLDERATRDEGRKADGVNPDTPSGSHGVEGA